MKLRLFIVTMAILVYLCLPSGAQQAQVPAETVVVATRVLPPFIVDSGDDLTGFSAELWSELARRTNVNFTWKKTENVKAILAAVESGEAAVGIAAISITAAREQQFDFSQPMFESGLHILVASQDEGGFSPRKLLGYFTQGAMPYLLGILALLILVPGHLVWWAERRLLSRNFPGHGLCFECRSRATEW
jgi:polar amino acid transport system substrate-binding protein